MAQDEINTIYQRKVLGLLALIALGLILWLSLPVGVGVFLGALVAFTVEPVYNWLRQKIGSQLAALGLVLLATLLFLGVLTWLILYLFSQGAELIPSLLANKETMQRKIVESYNSLARLFHFKSQKWSYFIELLNRFRDTVGLQNIIERMASYVKDLASTLSQFTVSAMITIFFSVLTMYAVLRNFDELSHRIEKVLPIKPKHTRALLIELRQAGRSVFVGTVLVGIIQGVFAGIGYFICGIKEAVFLGAITAFASLIPTIGTGLVTIPVGLYLMATQGVFWGIGEIIYGIVIVAGVVDSVIRPMLVGGKNKLSVLLTFIGLFGGLKLFDVVGLLLGPMIMSIAIAVLRMYEQEKEEI